MSLKGEHKAEPDELNAESLGFMNRERFARILLRSVEAMKGKFPVPLDLLHTETSLSGY